MTKAKQIPKEPDAKASERPQYSVGIVNYRTYDDVRRCIESVKRQSHRPVRIVVIDADGEAVERGRLHDAFPEVEIEARPNLGFAAGANRALARLHAQGPQPAFTLLLNPDVQLANDYAERMLERLCALPTVGLASGKLLRPGEAVVDSAGIILPPNRRPRDRGSGEADFGQYNRDARVFAASGAVLMLRTEALRDLEVDGEIFDEDFFMYHEDTDLSWRARKLGWQAAYIHTACAIHNRRWRPSHRFSIAPHVRRHSFKNHYLQIIKNDDWRDFARDLPVILAWEIVRLGYALVRDRAMLPAYLEVARLVPRALRKRAIIHERARELAREPARSEQQDRRQQLVSPITRAWSQRS
ncbi:MAG: glycosyltransferase family 2 protein [Myxococcota bacterium]|nr:glycosyltransferase family 2 protein [Myxococcota bacterium]